MLRFWKHRLNSFLRFASFKKIPGEEKAQTRLVQIKQLESWYKMTQKTTGEIRTLLSNAKLDFDEVENKALNDYLQKIFHSCPFTKDVCTTKQCIECSVFKTQENKTLGENKSRAVL